MNESFIKNRYMHNGDQVHLQGHSVTKPRKKKKTMFRKKVTTIVLLRVSFLL